jgi:hypothetical protein
MSHVTQMTRTRFAIPLAIDLILSDKESTVPATIMLDRLKGSRAHVEADREQGRREVFERRDELIARGTPEVLLTGMPLQAERTTAVTIRWDDWPANSVSGHICDSNPSLDGLSFGLANQDFAFAKFAAIELGRALGASARLESTFNHSIETEFAPKETGALAWIQDYYNLLDSSGATYDPVSQTFTPFPQRNPQLRTLEPWQEILERAVVRFLEQYRKANSDAITEGFSTYESYARQYVLELSEFGAVKDCWSVDLDESHHNQAFIEYDAWFALIRLSGVPRGLLARGAE